MMRLEDIERLKKLRHIDRMYRPSPARDDLADALYDAADELIAAAEAAAWRPIDQSAEFEAFIQQEAAHDGSGKPVNRLWAMRLARALLSERARADKAEAELAELMEDAFDAGFEASGEGWNGEYPGDAMTRDYYKVARNETLRRLARAVKSAAPGSGLEDSEAP